MKPVEKKNRKVLLLGGAVGAALIYSAQQMFTKGAFPWYIRQPEYVRMAAELLLLFLLFSLLLTAVKNTALKWGGVLIVLCLFTWAHAVFLPVAVSGLYLCYVIRLGRFIRVRLLRLSGRDGAACDFLAGAAALVAIFCLMSAAGVGDIPRLSAFVATSALLLMAEAGPELTEGLKHMGQGKPGDKRQSGYSRICLALLFTAACIQAGRMNIALDFDSLWYGLRSPYILDNGRGIYENMGTVGVVYTYSKGLEVLTLPLSSLPSYSFLLSFQLWLFIGCLAASYGIARLFMKHSMALFLTALLALTPGIANMAVTAKTDMATLLFQLIMINQIFSYLREGRSSWRHLAYAMAAFFFTWTLKPTALVFSTAVMGMAVLFLLWNRLLPQKERSGQERKSLGVLAMSLAALAGIWARTVIITGLPVTSVFSSLLTRLGFTMKYPYNVSRIPNSKADAPFGQWCGQLLTRVWNFFLRPLGEDMDHVILAWGGFFLLVMAIMWIVLRLAGPGGGEARNGKSGEDKWGDPVLYACLTTIYVPFLFVNLVSLAMLTQVDGNYFMLLYVLTGILAFSQLERSGNRELEQGIRKVLIPVIMYLFTVTTITSWSWCVGFTPASFHHKGYYGHMEKERQEMEAEGNGKIRELLEQNPRFRVIAVGEHPKVLSFPCSVQSYDDITGVWGNVVLVKKMDYFVEFMNYAKTDYVYAQAGYMKEEERCYTLVRDLIEYGKLEPVIYEEGNMLARVNGAGEYTEVSRAALAEFVNSYKTGKNHPAEE